MQKTNKRLVHIIQQLPNDWITLIGDEVLLELDTLPKLGLFSIEDRFLGGLASSIGVSDLLFNEFGLVAVLVFSATTVTLLTTRFMLNVDLRTLLFCGAGGRGGGGGGDVTSIPFRRIRIVATFSTSGANIEVAWNKHERAIRWCALCLIHFKTQC